MMNLPQGWIRATLEDLCVQARPGFASGQHNQAGNGIVHLRPMNITRAGRIDLSDVRYVNDNSDRRAAVGDILFNNTNSPALVGKTALVTVPEPVAYSNHMTRLRPPGGISSAFLAMQLHWLWMSGYFETVLNNHVNQASVATRVLLKTPVVIAPTSEQLRIVAVLDDHLSRIEGGVASVERATQLLLRFNEALLREAVNGDLGRTIGSGGADLLAQIEASRMRLTRRVRTPLTPVTLSEYSLPRGWRIGSLDQVSHGSGYGTSVKCDYDAPGTPVLRIPNIRSGEIDVTDLKHTVDASLDLSRLFLTPGDLLFVRTNGSRDLIGRVGVVRQGISMAYASYLIRYRLVPDGVEPDWVRVVTNSPLWRRYIVDSAASSAGQYNLNTRVLGQMPIPIPSREEQREILTELERRRGFAMVLDTAASESVDRSRTLREALFRAAFSGELVRQDPSDESASVLLRQIRTSLAVTSKSKNTSGRVEANEEQEAAQR